MCIRDRTNTIINFKDNKMRKSTKNASLHEALRNLWKKMCIRDRDNPPPLFPSDNSGAIVAVAVYSFGILKAITSPTITA